MSLHRTLLGNLRARGGNAKEFPLPRGWISGLVMSNGTDTAHDIDFAAGSCRDSGNLHNIETSSTFVKQLDVPWATGTAAGGLGTLQIDGAQTVTCGDGDGGSSRDTLTINSGTFVVTPAAGDTLIVVGSASNDGNYQVVTSSTTVAEVAAASFAAEATSAAVIHMIESDQTYHDFAILSGRTVDFGYDTSVTATNLLSESGYVYYRRLGSRRTDGSANWYQFFQHGDRVLLDAAVRDVSTSSTGLDVVSHTLTSIPIGVRVEAIISITLDFNNTGFHKVGHGDISTLTAPGSSDYDIETRAGHELNHWNGELLTDTSSVVKSHSSAEVDFWDIQTRGWVDRRGKDD